MSTQRQIGFHVKPKKTNTTAQQNFNRYAAQTTQPNGPPQTVVPPFKLFTPLVTTEIDPENTAEFLGNVNTLARNRNRANIPKGGKRQKRTRRNKKQSRRKH
jgi:hypothetical protein